MERQVKTILDTTPEKESEVKEALRYDPEIYWVKPAVDAPSGMWEVDYIHARETAIEEFLRNNSTSLKITNILDGRKVKDGIR